MVLFSIVRKQLVLTLSAMRAHPVYTKCFKLFFYGDFLLLVLLILGCIYQGYSLSQAQVDLSSMQHTPLEHQTCSHLCGPAYQVPTQQICCRYNSNTSCLLKQTCQNEMIELLKQRVSSESFWMYGLFISIGLCMLILVGVICFYLFKNYRWRRNAQLASRLGQLMGLGNHSAWQSDSRQIRISLLNGSYVDDEIEDACSICLESLKGKRVSRLNCNHSFHCECIYNWVRYRSVCPICRSPQ